MSQLNTLPLSLSLDEAVDGLDALQLVRLPRLTPFLQNNFGRETLFFYLQGLLLKLSGVSIFSLRFASILAGVLTIPLLYAVGQRLALGRSTLNVQHFNLNAPGLLAAAGFYYWGWMVWSRERLRPLKQSAVLSKPSLSSRSTGCGRSSFSRKSRPSAALGGGETPGNPGPKPSAAV